MHQQELNFRSDLNDSTNNVSTVEISNAVSFSRQLLWVGLVPLLIGGLIYLTLRDRGLIMFSWFEVLSLGSILKPLHISSDFVFSLLPEWFLYALPDGLYLLSFTTLSLLVWENRITKYSIVWIFSVPILALISEPLQGFGFFPGTFDPLDLLFYGIGTVIPLHFFANWGISTDKKPKAKCLKSCISIILVFVFLVLAFAAGDTETVQFFYLAKEILASSY